MLLHMSSLHLTLCLCVCLVCVSPRVGLPVIGPAAPPNLSMKPHEGYAYP